MKRKPSWDISVLFPFRWTILIKCFIGFLSFTDDLHWQRPKSKQRVDTLIQSFTECTADFNCFSLLFVCLLFLAFFFANCAAKWGKIHCIRSHHILCGQCEAGSKLLYNAYGLPRDSLPRIGDGQPTICQARGETEQSMLGRVNSWFEFRIWLHRDEGVFS